MEEGGRRRLGRSWTYLKVEAVKSWAELLSASQAVLLTGAGHAGEEAEQQEVRKQDFHGAGVESKMLKHKEMWVAIRTVIVWRPHTGDARETLFGGDSSRA